MTAQTKKILTIVLTIIVTVAAGLAIFFIAKEVNRNPFIGTWNADDLSVSLEFHEDGSADVTYNNSVVPVVKAKHNGTVKADYAYHKQSKDLSVTLFFYSKEITSNYTYSIKNGELLLTDTSTDETTRFIFENPVEG